MPRIAVIPGDGIGEEVIREAVRILQGLSSRHHLGMDLTDWSLGAERYLAEGVTITDEEFRSLAEDYDAILLGALGDPRVPDNRHARDILLGLRFRLDLYVNYRPCRLPHPRVSPLQSAEANRELFLEIFRENTEGLYGSLGGRFKPGTPDEVAIQEDLNTRKGVERIIRAAFEHARGRGRDQVTMVDKANAMPHAGGLWRETFEVVSRDFPEIETGAMYVDAMVMDLVRRPERYSVLVTANLFGDILSDLAAAITGGLGLAASVNLHPDRHALFEPVHGSAPDIAGTGKANPMGAVRCVALMLEHFGHPGLAEEVEEAVAAAVAEGETTPDLGGRRTTRQVGEWMARRLDISVSGADRPAGE